MKIKSIDMTIEDYRWHLNDYNGICLHCGKIKYGGCEPDARKYYCEECEHEEVYGIDELLIMGILNFIGD